MTSLSVQSQTQANPVSLGLCVGSFLGQKLEGSSPKSIVAAPIPSSPHPLGPSTSTDHTHRERHRRNAKLRKRGLSDPQTLEHARVRCSMFAHVMREWPRGPREGSSESPKKLQSSVLSLATAPRGAFHAAPRCGLVRYVALFAWVRWSYVRAILLLTSGFKSLHIFRLYEYTTRRTIVFTFWF